MNLHPLIFALALVGLLVGGIAHAGAEKRPPAPLAGTARPIPSETPDLRAETEAQLKAILPCKATVEKTSPCSALLIAADGKRLHLGGPGAPPEVVRFVHSLQKGKTYALPDAFLQFQKGARKKPL